MNAAAELYEVQKLIARRFARAVGIKEDHNFPRAMDPADETHVFVENWQPLYNVRFLEKVDAAGNVLEHMLIWGQPRHSMQTFYDMARLRWKDLPAWGTFRQALAPDAKRGMKGFRVSKLSAEASRQRLKRKDLPVELATQVPTLPCALVSNRSTVRTCVSNDRAMRSPCCRERCHAAHPLD